jgi:hypothetical protein
MRAELLESHALLGLRGRSCILDLIQNRINPNGPAYSVVLPGMNRIEKLRSDPRVHFTDRVAEMAPIYAAVDVCVLLIASDQPRTYRFTQNPRILSRLEHDELSTIR